MVQAYILVDLVPYRKFFGHFDWIFILFDIVKELSLTFRLNRYKTRMIKVFCRVLISLND